METFPQLIIPRPYSQMKGFGDTRLTVMLPHPQGRGNLNHEKEEFAHEHAHIKTLEEVVETIKPTAIIGEWQKSTVRVKDENRWLEVQHSLLLSH